MWTTEVSSALPVRERLQDLIRCSSHREKIAKEQNQLPMCQMLWLHEYRQTAQQLSEGHKIDGVSARRVFTNFLHLYSFRFCRPGVLMKLVSVCVCV